jgi:acyl-homoserine lactone synthase
MIEVVTKENAHLYRDALEQMYRLRHRLFVEQMKWEDLRKPDGREIDQFDNEDAIYLLLIEDGVVTGSHRLLPTTGPHLFSEIFTDMCEQRGRQTGPAIYELNRTGTDPLLPRDRQLQGMRLLLVGLLEFAFSAGIEKLTLLTPLHTLYHCLMAGVTVNPLGLPKLMDGERQAAVAFVTDATSLGNVRDYFYLQESIVRYYTDPTRREGGIYRIPATLSHRHAAE